MNRTRIEWADYTWNPVTGCTFGCSWCYACKMAHRLKGRYGYPRDNPFTPTFHEPRINEPYLLKKPSKIFTCSMGDLFDPTVLDSWQQKIVSVIAGNPRHTFLVLTKQPHLIPPVPFPSNLWMGVSVTTQKELWRLEYLRKVNVTFKFVSFEPLLEQITKPFDFVFPFLEGLDWVIIGALTPVSQHRKQWALDIFRECKRLHIPMFIKNNFGWTFPGSQQYPEVMKK